MEWQRLDIRKASILKKQVDLALSALKQAITDGDANRRQALVQSFLVQIDEIEEFRSVNDSDERSILFERERLRLRKSVQETTAQFSSASTPGSSSKNNKNDPHASSSSSSSKHHSSSKANSSSSSRGPFNVSSSGKEKKGVSFNGDMDDGMSESPSAKGKSGGGGIHAMSNSPASPSNIYRWESEQQVKLRRAPIAIEGAVFAPAEQSGVYVRDDHHADDSGAYGEHGNPESKMDAKYTDMYFVLTTEEVSILASRLQKKSEDKAHFKSQASAAGVQHSTPFVDKERIEQMLYRETHKERWTTARDMRPNMK
jgi:hypothetical protein